MNTAIYNSNLGVVIVQADPGPALLNSQARDLVRLAIEGLSFERDMHIILRETTGDGACYFYHLAGIDTSFRDWHLPISWGRISVDWVRELAEDDSIEAMVPGATPSPDYTVSVSYSPKTPGYGNHVVLSAPGGLSQTGVVPERVSMQRPAHLSMQDASRAIAQAWATVSECAILASSEGPHGRALWNGPEFFRYNFHLDRSMNYSLLPWGQRPVPRATYGHVQWDFSEVGGRFVAKCRKDGGK